MTITIEKDGHTYVLQWDEKSAARNAELLQKLVDLADEEIIDWSQAAQLSYMIGTKRLPTEAS